ncbi:MAG: hypothetical protein MJZ99_01460 [Bacteroidales bacterium]|nr:hypothetical protein [Candidatus Colimorpha merdihippi]MCQ2281283.1 hypothetical protein [Bacteroidales bacterium]
MAWSRRIVWVLAALVLLASCGKENRCRVPIGDAACSIDPNSALYPGINNCDGFEYIVGGYNGVVVIRTGFNTFAAYERTCPQDSARLVMAEGYGNIVLECPACGSKFNTFDDGAPLEGSRTYCYLYKYGTYYDGQLLYISNY